MNLVLRSFSVALVYIWLVLGLLVAIDVTLPSDLDIRIPGGAVHLIRQPGQVRIETWFIDTQRVTGTLPIDPLYDVLLYAQLALVGFGCWILWHGRRPYVVASGKSDSKIYICTNVNADAPGTLEP